MHMHAMPPVAGSQPAAWRCALLAAVLALSACTTVPDPAMRETVARDAARRAGLVWTLLPTDRPMVAALPPAGSVADHLVVYIEGDGLAWRTADWPSDDPTPTHPLALLLAESHPGLAPRAWLARPCQYVDAARSGCPMALWTSGRQGAQALQLSHQALDQIKASTGARTLTLVGHSGGGALATLLMSERDDVTHLVTVAANVDLAHWTAHHRLSPQTGSFNPAERVGALQGRSQYHLAGEHDRVVPVATVRSFARHFGPGLEPRVEVVPQTEHEAGWVPRWKQQGAVWLQPLEVPGASRPDVQGISPLTRASKMASTRERTFSLR
jgi:predicted esterase